MVVSVYGILHVCALVTFAFSVFREEDHCSSLNFAEHFKQYYEQRTYSPKSNMFYLSFQVLLKSTPPLSLSRFPGPSVIFIPVFSSTFWLYLTFHIHHALHLLVIMFLSCFLIPFLHLFLSMTAKTVLFHNVTFVF